MKVMIDLTYEMKNHKYARLPTDVNICIEEKRIRDRNAIKY